MRLILTGFLYFLIPLLPLFPFGAQESLEAAAQDHFFSGTITAISTDKITVSRTVLGKNSSVRTFLMTPETRVEGKPKVKARVTVRFVASDDGDRAVHIIVRSSQKK